MKSSKEIKVRKVMSEKKELVSFNGPGISLQRGIQAEGAGCSTMTGNPGGNSLTTAKDMGCALHRSP